MTPEELREELDAGRFRPAYLLLGEEPLLRDDALAALRRAVLVEGASDFNWDLLPAASTTPARLRDALAMLPVMAPRRLVCLQGLEDRRAAARELADALADLLPGLDPECSTVLVVTTPKADRRQRWVKAFNDSRVVVDCEPPKNRRAVAAFVKAEAARQGVAFERGAAEALAERIGPQLLMLRQEITKASLLAGPDETVTRAHVALATSDLAEEPIWELTDAIGEGRGASALQVLAKLLGSGAAPPALLGSLANHFRKLVRVRSGQQPLGPPFVVKKLQSQAGRYTPARLRRCLDAIHEVDQVLKGRGGLAPSLALERLVMGLSA
ncbi:MAG: DNA polymerase III subunit delta [Myxococcales bacterium]|nr:DNA polymerase III subunit delta [Myxococcales bacterium]